MKKKTKKLTKNTSQNSSPYVEYGETERFYMSIQAGIDSENIEEMYTKCHAAIRADPAPKAKVEKTVDKKRWNRARLSYAQRTVFKHDSSFVKKSIIYYLYDDILYVFALYFLTPCKERILLRKRRPPSSVPKLPRNKTFCPFSFYSVSLYGIFSVPWIYKTKGTKNKARLVSIRTMSRCRPSRTHINLVIRSRRLICILNDRVM